MASKTFTQWTLSASTRTTILLPLVVAMAMWTFGMDTTRRGCASSTGWTIWISPHVHSGPPRFPSLIVFLLSVSLTVSQISDIDCLTGVCWRRLCLGHRLLLHVWTGNAKHETNWKWYKRWSDSPLRITLLRRSQKTLCSLDPCRTRRRGLNEQSSTCAVSTSWLCGCHHVSYCQTLSKKMHYIKHYFQSLIIAWWNNLVCLVGHCIVLILSELVYLFWIWCLTFSSSTPATLSIFSLCRSAIPSHFL